MNDLELSECVLPTVCYVQETVLVFVLFINLAHTCTEINYKFSD